MVGNVTKTQCGAVFEELICKRCEEICNNISKEDWYLKMQDEMIETRKILGDSKAKLEHLEKYDYLCLGMHYRTEIELYKRAIDDFISFTKMVS